MTIQSDLMTINFAIVEGLDAIAQHQAAQSIPTIESDEQLAMLLHETHELVLRSITLRKA